MHSSFLSTRFFPLYIKCWRDYLNRVKQLAVRSFLTVFHQGYLHIAECGLTEEMPDSCAVTSGTLRTGGCAHPVHDAPGSERDAGERASLLRTRRWKTLPPLRGRVYGRRILYEYQPYGRSDHVGRQYGKKRVPLLERIHGWRTGAGLSQCSSVSIRLISWSGLIPAGNFVNGDWRDRYSCRVSSVNFVEEAF